MKTGEVEPKRLGSTSLRDCIVPDYAASNRVADPDERDGYYSGKKKQHTLKSQVAVDEDTGAVVDISESVPGPTADLTLLKESGLMGRLPPGVGALGDLAYVGSTIWTPTSKEPHRVGSPGASHARRQIGSTTAPSRGAASESSTRWPGCGASKRSHRRIDTTAGAMPCV